MNFKVLLAAVGLWLVMGCTPATDEARDASRLETPPESENSSMAESASALENSQWRVLAYESLAGKVVDVLDGTQVTLAFGADGRITGTAGCNNYFASYELTDDAIGFGMPGATNMFCGDVEGLMDQEGGFLASLSQVARFELVGSALTLRNSDGQPVVNLESQPQ